MLPSDSRYQLNDAEVAAKVMDGEAIIINLENGMYYSIDGAGAEIWSLIANGHAIEEVASVISRRFSVEKAEVESDIGRLVEQLLEEGLVQPADTETTGAMPASSENGARAPVPYTAPELNAYRDMADLLALDPPMPGLRATPWRGPDSDA